jgi:hypothetical protein
MREAVERASMTRGQAAVVIAGGLNAVYPQETSMRIEFVLVTTLSMVLVSGVALSGEHSNADVRFAQADNCPQIIHCGTKDGKRKEYPTKCDAEKDGATNITPKIGRTCEATQ